MLNYVLEVGAQKFITIAPPPRKLGVFFPILVLTSRKYFQESLIFLQIKKKIINIKNSEVSISSL